MQRLLAIIQLCLAFSLLFWYLIQPFMGEYFALRSRMLPYEYVMGTSELLKKEGYKEKLARLELRFKELPPLQQTLLRNDYNQLSAYAKRPVFQKILDGLKTFLVEIPPFEQAWIFFSILISILILLKKEGAPVAAWILPLIVLAYAIDNQMSGKVSSPPDLHLFPTEEKILNQPLHGSLTQQKEQLQQGWDRYLIDHWSTIQSDNEREQIEEGEFQFTLARLKLLHGQPRSEWLNVFHEKLNPIWLILFLGWNFCFALLSNYSRNLKAPMPAK